ncbi:hypothetical protein DRQ05_03450 [bacterium]|nr:MAG: hypothetical protein DRQ05_03450 [bacterium]
MFGGETINIQLGFWRIVASLALVAFAFILYRKTYPSISLSRRIILGASRSFAFLAMLFLLFNPMLVSTRITHKDPMVVILIDSSKSMSIEDVAGRSRLSAALRTAEGLIAGLKGRFGVKTLILPFADHILRPSSVVDSSLEASGEGTDIWGALFEAEERYKGENLKCIVLISDGRVTRGMVEAGRGIDVPVFSIGVGDTLEGPDISIDDVDYPRTTYTGEKVNISAVIKAVGFKDSTVTVSLMRGSSVIDSKDIWFNDLSQRKEMTLKLTAGKEGTYRFSVAARPKAREKFRENNAESFRIEVLKSKIRILFIDEHLDWNTAFLRSLVKSSKRFKLSVVTWVPTTGYASLPQRKPWSFPDEGTLLSNYDIVMISDEMILLNKTSIVKSLKYYVRGGGKMLLLADEHSPLLDEESFSALEDVVPIKRISRAKINVSEFYPAVLGNAPLSPLSSVFSQCCANPKDIPPIPCIIGGVGIKSSALILLRVENESKDYPFLVVQDFGEGMSAVVLGFPLWRWKLAGEEQSNLYNRFFSSVFQYLAEDRKGSVVEVVSDRTVYRKGGVVGLKAFVRSETFSGVVRGEIWKAGERGPVLVRKFLFDPVTGKKGRFAKSIKGLADGEYRIVASISQGTGSKFRNEIGITVLPTSVEFVKTSMDKGLLENVSRLTGGRMVNPNNLMDALKRCDMKKASYEIRESHLLFNNIFVLFIILVLFSIEWTLRKLWGLV